MAVSFIFFCHLRMRAESCGGNNMNLSTLGLAFCLVILEKLSIKINQIGTYIHANRTLQVAPLCIRMQHCRRPATDGAEFWISCKRPAFVSSFSRLQKIQNKRPWYWVAPFVTAGLFRWCKNWFLIIQNMSTNVFLHFVQWEGQIMPTKWFLIA